MIVTHDPVIAEQTHAGESSTGRAIGPCLMTIGQAFLEALESLSGDKMRSGLTVLGIVIGVAAVIAMLAVGKGTQESITGSINGIGTNLLFVFRGTRGNEGRPFES